MLIAVLRVIVISFFIVLSVRFLFHAMLFCSTFIFTALNQKVIALVFSTWDKFEHNISFIIELQELMLYRSLICWKLAQTCRGSN
jgi:hypothetical protein